MKEDYDKLLGGKSDEVNDSLYYANEAYKDAVANNNECIERLMPYIEKTSLVLGRVITRVDEYSEDINKQREINRLLLATIEKMQSRHENLSACVGKILEIIKPEGGG